MRKADIERVFMDVSDKATKLGLREEGKLFVLREAYPAEGIAWSVDYCDAATGDLVGGRIDFIPDNGSLSTNKRVAYDTLRTVNTVLGAVLKAQEG